MKKGCTCKIRKKRKLRSIQAKGEHCGEEVEKEEYRGRQSFSKMTL